MSSYQLLEKLIKGRGPREKMIEFGPTILKDHELLATIFGTGYGDENVIELSRRVLADYGAKAILKAKTVGDVQDTVGLPPVKSCQLLATLELGRRLFAPEFGEFPTIRTPEDAYKIFQPMEQLKKETCVALYLNAQNRVMHRETVAVGTLREIFIDPCEVYEPAIACRALGVVVAHNHPSGDSQPSESDRKNAELVKKVGELLQRPLLDYLVIGRGKFSSVLHP